MSRILIKICGLSDPLTAIAAAKAGADFIGVVFHPASPRNVDVSQAAKIAEAAKKAGVMPVAVFVNSNAEEIVKICKATGINYAQLHGENARQSHHLLPDNLHRIYVCSINEQGEINSGESDYRNNLNNSRDFLLFDNQQAGSGKVFDWSGFNYDGPFRWFLSGGLNINNVESGIKQLNPSGIDVSSGVEKSPGQKDIKLIEQFIDKVRGSEK